MIKTAKCCLRIFNHISTAVPTTSVLEEKHLKKQNALRAYYPRLILQNDFSISARETQARFSTSKVTVLFHDIEKMHFTDNKTTILMSLTPIRLHVIIHQRLSGNKKHNFSYITCVRQRDNINEKTQDNISTHAHPSVNRKVNYNAFPNQKCLRISQNLPHNLDHTYFDEFSLCRFFSTSRKSSFIKGKLCSFSLPEVYHLLGSSWTESNQQRI